jgi:hypothetical protein
MKGEHLSDMFEHSLHIHPLNRSPMTRREKADKHLASEAEAIRALLQEADPAYYASELGKLIEKPIDINPLESDQKKVRKLVHQGLISRAATLAENSNKVIPFNADAVHKMEQLHPKALHMHHNGDDPLTDDITPHEIPLAALFKAAQTAVRGSAAGPDGHAIDAMTRIFKGLDIETFNNADPTTAINEPKYALITALHGLINSIARGWVPKATRCSFFSATGFALRKDDGSIRPIACGQALRRLTARCMVVANTPKLVEVLGVNQFAVGYPGGVEACKLGLEQMLEEDESLAFGWIDYRSAFNTVCRFLIQDAIELFIPWWNSFFRRSYGIVSKIIFFKESDTGALTPHFQPSLEGVQQGDPLGPALFSLAQKVLQMLIRRTLGDTIELEKEGVSEQALVAKTWDRICQRFDASDKLARELKDALKSMADFKNLDQMETTPETPPLEQTEQPKDQPDSPQPTTPNPKWALCTLKAFMDDQFPLGRPAQIAFFTLINRIISKHFGNLEVNVDPVKGKSGMFIRGAYSKLHELRQLYPGTIISAETPAQNRGVKVLGSYLAQSSPEYIKHKLEAQVNLAFTTAGLGIARLTDRQIKYHLMQKSFAHRLVHLFRTLPPSSTAELASRLDPLHVDLFKHCMEVKHTPPKGWLTEAFSAQICSPLKLGGMGLPSMATLRFTAYLGCWASLLQGEGGDRWARSFPALAHYRDEPWLMGQTQPPYPRSNCRLIDEWTACIEFLRTETAADEQDETATGQKTGLDLLIATTTPVSFQSLCPDTNKRDQSLSQTSLTHFALRHRTRAITARLLQTADDQASPANIRTEALRRHRSLLTASAPEAWLPWSCLPKDHNSSLNNFAWTTATEIRLFTSLSCASGRPARCSLCKTKENGRQVGQPLQQGYHLITGCKHVNQGKAAHRNIEATIKSYFTRFTTATARSVTENLIGTNCRPDILLSNLNGNGGKDVYLDVSTTNPYGKTNQTILDRRTRETTTSSPDSVPCEPILSSAATRESHKVRKYRQLCNELPAPATFFPFVLETTGGFGLSTAATIRLLGQNVRDSSDINPEIVVYQFKRDVSFALHRGIAQQLSVVTDRAYDDVELDRLRFAERSRG